MTELLTVNVITYNQEKYIERCLDSILSQKTNFDFIVRVFDDCSNDNTLQILKEYKAKYPNKVFIYPNEVNQGAKDNAIRSYENIKTKYYMYIEGDDYICNKNKFKKQVDILENNPDCSHCANKTLLKPIEEQKKYVEEQIYPKEKAGKYSAEYFVKNASIITHISSRIVRTDSIYIDKNNPVPYIFDFTQAYFLIEKGNMYLIDDVYNVYNYTGTGIYTGATLDSRIDRLINLFRNFNKITNDKYKLSTYKLLAGEIYDITNRLQEKKIKEKLPILLIIKKVKHYVLPPMIIDLCNQPRIVSKKLITLLNKTVTNK